MSRTVYTNPDPNSIHELELVSDDDKMTYNTLIEMQTPAKHEEYIRHSTQGRIGIVVGFIDPKTGTAMVGWSIASKDDRDRMKRGNAAFSDEEYRSMPAAQKAGLRAIAQDDYTRIFKTRAKFIAYKRAIPAGEYLLPDRRALCERCPARAVSVVANMVGTIVGEWAHRLPQCHCPGRDPGPTCDTKEVPSRKQRKNASAIKTITRLLRKLAG
jgi:hypothetical protein